MSNPFRIHGVVTGSDFTDREPELTRIGAALEQGGSKLLVYGERRMGKTSALREAMNQHAKTGGISLLADFSTASSPIDLSNRVLDGATRALGRRWRDVAQELARRVGLSMTVGIDPVSQGPTISLELGLRDNEMDTQRATLGRVLDSLNDLAEERGQRLSLVLDEFQEIHRFGGEAAEWHLRGVIQHHEQVSYVVAGSKTHLIQRMMSKGRAFYRLFDVLRFGPIEPGHFAEWIDERMADAGVEPIEAGTAVLALTGPRTRDVVQLARKTFDLAVSLGSADSETVEAAYLELIEEEDELIRGWWEKLTVRQQNVLRAVAAGSDGLTAASTIRRFALKSSAAVSQIAAKFVEEGVLESLGPAGYRLDSPFVRGWIVSNALPDMGIHLPPTHRADS